MAYRAWKGITGGVLLATVCAVPVAAAPRAAASQSEILEGVQSCAASLASTGIDEASLVSDGWSKGVMSESGKPLASDVIFYGKGNLMLMSVRTSAGQTPICSILARIGSVDDYPALQDAMAAAYGKPIKDDGKGEQMFIARDHRVIDLASTGSNKNPSVRIAVGPVFQETK
ncbi:hypothetical protein [Sphingomonas mollis]|uniref:Uncharacterized protein n=1 Tax=Sphingomonas mollis TaxID=2795726 RepID=A0ABS0XNN0_9SPHN|nr:hypothetical protein [Sphingomonas sp. BT553]MBJ6121340.1 hypothetical protein [Sphingomonas sp. BT553]